MRVLVTGGSGFIGSAVIRLAIRDTDAEVLNLDMLTYAASPDAVAACATSERYRFVRGDIGDRTLVRALLEEFRPDAILSLAAETHVDRSIDGPAAFVETNVVGTVALLEAAADYWGRLPEDRRAAFRFHHVSTDEVFGSLPPVGRFRETTPYDPRSPYSASKAASDHFVRAWNHTYGLPVVLSNCSNNYGPWQFPEKLVPLITINALLGLELPVYGRGINVRDWLHVDDHARALLAILTRGAVGESYNVGGEGERRNIDVVHAICDLVDALAGPLASGPRRSLVRYVTDRPGHDQRYAIDSGKIRRSLGWAPHFDFDTGLRDTVAWYLAHRPWWERVRAERYAGARLGTRTTAKR
ncbi:MAG: dTDP-glucose 4,6-dehydratase [Alphaproteobacteria bacterium]|nr:dTDP-glucose 4,6-dehydratase [Alphaproteobacteria bacterium]